MTPNRNAAAARTRGSCVPSGRLAAFIKSAGLTSVADYTAGRFEVNDSGPATWDLSNFAPQGLKSDPLNRTRR